MIAVYTCPSCTCKVENIARKPAVVMARRSPKGAPIYEIDKKPRSRLICGLED